MKGTAGKLARRGRGLDRARRTIRRKNLLLDQTKIDRARRIFRAPTETEAIHRALDAVADLEDFRVQLDAGLETLIGAGGFDDRFA